MLSNTLSTYIFTSELRHKLSDALTCYATTFDLKYVNKLDTLHLF